MTFAQAVERAVHEKKMIQQVDWLDELYLVWLDVNPPDGRGFYLEVGDLHIKYHVTAADVETKWKVRR